MRSFECANRAARRRVLPSNIRVRKLAWVAAHWTTKSSGSRRGKPSSARPFRLRRPAAENQTKQPRYFVKEGVLSITRTRNRSRAWGRPEANIRQAPCRPQDAVSQVVPALNNAYTQKVLKNAVKRGVKKLHHPRVRADLWPPGHRQQLRAFGTTALSDMVRIRERFGSINYWTGDVALAKECIPRIRFWVGTVCLARTEKCGGAQRQLQMRRASYCSIGAQAVPRIHGIEISLRSGLATIGEGGRAAGLVAIRYAPSISGHGLLTTDPRILVQRCAKGNSPTVQPAT